jgi:hypothetical protein
MWGKVGPEHGGLISDFVSNIFVYDLTALSSQDCAQVGHPVYFSFWAQKCQKRPWQWYCVEVSSTTDMDYCVARLRKYDHEKNDVKTQSQMKHNRKQLRSVAL